jgi:hypothetical protein
METSTGMIKAFAGFTAADSAELAKKRYFLSNLY